MYVMCFVDRVLISQHDCVSQRPCILITRTVLTYAVSHHNDASAIAFVKKCDQCPNLNRGENPHSQVGMMKDEMLPRTISSFS